MFSMNNHGLILLPEIDEHDIIFILEIHCLLFYSILINMKILKFDTNHVYNKFKNHLYPIQYYIQTDTHILYL